jgi:hypothetical protein
LHKTHIKRKKKATEKNKRQKNATKDNRRQQKPKFLFCSAAFCLRLGSLLSSAYFFFLCLLCLSLPSGDTYDCMFLILLLIFGSDFCLFKDIRVALCDAALLFPSCNFSCVLFFFLRSFAFSCLILVLRFSFPSVSVAFCDPALIFVLVLDVCDAPACCMLAMDSAICIIRFSLLLRQFVPAHLAQRLEGS